MSSEQIESSPNPAVSVQIHTPNDENDFHNPNTTRNLATLNTKVLATTGTNIEDSSSCDVATNQQLMESSNSILQFRNSKSSLMDNLEDDEDDTNAISEENDDDLKASMDGTSSGGDQSEMPPLVDKGGMKPNSDNDFNVTTPEEANTASQNVPALGSSSSSKSSAEAIVPAIVPFHHHLPTHLASGFSSSRSLNATPNWDNFVRSGARLKSLVVDAIGEAKKSVEAVQNDSRNKKRGRKEGDEPSSLANQRSRVVTVADFSAELAREKTAQVLQLKRQLKDAEAQAAAVQAANSSLREETSSSQSRLDRTVEALRIAGNNASKARADADAAEATAAALAQTLLNLQTVLTETKTASQILHKEQLQVNATVAAVESKLLQKEAEIVKAQKDLMSLRQANIVLECSNSKLLNERDELEIKSRLYEQTLEDLKREKEELAAIEKARKDRAEKVEQEWQKAQALLVEATSGQAAAKETQALLEETIGSLKKTNEELHGTLKEQQRLAREYKHRMSESLGKAEKEVQRLRISAETTSEEMARLKVEKLAADTQIQQLKSRLASTERSLKAASVVDASSETPSFTNASLESAMTPTATHTPNQLCFQLPPLSNAKKASLTTPAITEKENIGVEKGELCCMCFKASIGIMKTCQCGLTTCHRKAHANCIKLSCLTPGPSVSHPGTPAPKLPVVLCDSVLNKIRASTSKEK